MLTNLNTHCSNLVPIDLHCHSEHSDGNLCIQDLLNLAKSNGGQFLALTDHDTLDGLAEAQQYARQIGINLINGVEISVTWDNSLVHILGLNIDASNLTLKNQLHALQNERLTRGKLIAAKLATIGIKDAFARAMQYCKHPQALSRTHFAQFLVNSGYAKAGQAFSTYLAPGKVGYIATKWANLSDAVGWILGSGGIAVIAHPCRYKFKPWRLQRLIRQFKEYGGRGIEVISSSHSTEDVNYIAKIAIEYDLLASNGSDFHGNTQMNRNITLGVSAPLPNNCKPIYSALNINWS